MSGRLTAKSVIITGAAGGLGRALALTMAAEGARLALCDSDAPGLQDTARQLAQNGAEAITLVGDVTQAATHATLVDQAVRAFGGVDSLCNVAGLLGPAPLEQATPEAFDRLMHVNCLAQLLAIQHAVPALRASGTGSIVNVASVGALVALPMMSLYCASKAAVLGLTRALAAELAPHIRCNAICPGGIDTPMARSLLEQVPEADRAHLLDKLTGRQLLKRFARPEEIAQAIVFLASNESSFLTGAVIAADAGHSAS